MPSDREPRTAFAEDRPAPSREPRYRIGAVVRATGISADALRVWERRYGALAPARSERGGRLYSDADIARLRLLRKLLDQGHAIGRIAALPDAELVAMRDRLPAPAADDPYAAVRAAFVDAIGRDDLVTAQHVLARAALVVPARELALHVIAPLLREIGDRWAHGTLCVAHEHAASGLLRTSLGTLLGTFAAAAQGAGAAPTLIAATPPGELHEFGALLAAVLAAAAGWRVIYLGPNLPASEIVGAAARVDADVVALSLVRGGSAANGAAEVQRLVAELPARVSLVTGGAGAGRHPELARRGTVLRDLDDLPVWLDEQRRRLAAAPA